MTYPSLLEQVVVYLHNGSAHLVVVLALRAVTLLQLIPNKTDLHDLNPLVANGLNLPLLVRCNVS